MKKIFFFAALVITVFSSCQSGPERNILGLPTVTNPDEIRRPYTIIDHKNRAVGGSIPAWVDLWLDSGLQDIEELPPFNNRYVFIGRNEGVHLNPLNLWMEGFSPELDFPRLAAARIERRFSSEAGHPDHEYGSFYEALIKAASDAPWIGATKADDFWIRRRYIPDEDNNEELETWEFIILLTIDRDLFASQFQDILDDIIPFPTPTIAQIEAANSIIENFFTGF
ncbi:MAG: hypothetical protein FWG77_04435 [Treponema sp.]|nr:hypothetical protein [Treponema sp.]